MTRTFGGKVPRGACAGREFSSEAAVYLVQVLTISRSRAHRSWLFCAALCALALLLHVDRAHAAEAGTQALAADEVCKTHWTIEDDWLPYCRTQRLGESHEGIRRAVVIIHGKQRNAKSYFDAVNRLATEEGRQSDTLVLAMQFLTEVDVKANKLSKQVLYWDQDGWKHGMKSLNGPNISSFEVLDRVLKRLIDQNPKLQKIVIAGHSAGAQFVQKHASGRRLDTSKWPGQLSYVVTNPGTYMYLSPERPAPTAACSDNYNDYRYGPEDNKLEYFAGTSPDSLWTKLAQYPVSILLGDQDTDESDIDTSCAAEAQGKTRFERGKNFHRLTVAHRPAHLSGVNLSRFRLFVVPLIGHEFERMWDSRCGRQLLFGDGNCSSGPPPKAAFPLK